MKEEKLKELLSKYYKGTSTLQEEDELKTFFSGNDFPPGYEVEKDIFRSHISNIPSLEADSEFALKVIRTLDQDLPVSEKARSGKIVQIAIGIAATLLIVTGLYFFIASSSRELKDTYEDPRIAYVEAMKILNEVSAKLNKGASALKPIGKLYGSADESIRTVGEVTGKIDRSLEKLELIEKINSENINLK